MSDDTQPRGIAPLPLTPRQRRLRYLTVIVLAVIATMFVVGMTHPFFNLTPPPALTDAAHPLAPAVLKTTRNAFAVKLLMIGVYWAACILLTLFLPVFAWLYTREIRIQELIARRDIWRGVAARNAAVARERLRDAASNGGSAPDTPARPDRPA